MKTGSRDDLIKYFDAVETLNNSLLAKGKNGFVS